MITLTSNRAIRPTCRELNCWVNFVYLSKNKLQKNPPNLELLSRKYSKLSTDRSPPSPYLIESSENGAFKGFGIIGYLLINLFI